LKVSLITPVDIKYSYRGTEWHVYEYAKFLHESGVDTEILITENNSYRQAVSNYKYIKARYKMIPKSIISCQKYLLPFSWHLTIYRNLPKSGIIYFPYSVYDYIINILMRPKNQKYVIGCHSMHLKMGQLVYGHRILEATLNSIIRALIRINDTNMDNLYCHALNREQANYMIKVFNFKRQNVFCIPPMIEAKSFYLAHNKSNRLRILHIGGMEKDALTVLDIIKELNIKGEIDKFEFYFIGDIPTEHRKQFTALKNIHFLGILSDNEKNKKLTEVDVLLIPAFEVFPKVMLEGLASGLYIVTSKKNAAWKDLKDLRANATISENGGKWSYIAILLSLASKKTNDKYLFDKCRMNNRRIAIKNFDKKVILLKIFEMFKK
jgi:glycosyltransferase involved in cell wall biosynthesis